MQLWKVINWFLKLVQCILWIWARLTWLWFGFSANFCYYPRCHFKYVQKWLIILYTSTRCSLNPLNIFLDLLDWELTLAGLTSAGLIKQTLTNQNKGNLEVKVNRFRFWSYKSPVRNGTIWAWAVSLLLRIQIREGNWDMKQSKNAKIMESGTGD